MNESVRVEHARLRNAATQGALAELCDRHDLDLLVVFGSALAADVDPRDLDVAVRLGSGDGAHDTLKILDDLYRLTGSERIDLLVLNRAAPWSESEPSPTESRCSNASRATSPTPKLQPSWSDSIPTGSERWVWS